MFKNMVVIILLVFNLFFCLIARADDSTVGYSDGSLVFTKDNDIGLENESLIIQSSKIHIFYTFYNHANHAITKSVAFPFPANPYDGSIPTRARPCFDKYIEKKPSKDCPFLDFTGKINGKEVKNYKIHYLAIDQNGRDITKILTDNDIPLSSYFVTGVRDYDGSYGNGEIDRNPALKAKLKKLNILPNWSTQILLSWQETFPAKSKLLVEETYTPSIGTSLKISCDDKYCLRENVKQFLDKICHAKSNSEVKTVQYVLKTGANWKNGLIGHFHLEVIPSKSEIVGFCYPNPMRFAEGKYIGDFENFLPEKDLAISFLNQPKVENN